MGFEVNLDVWLTIFKGAAYTVLAMVIIVSFIITMHGEGVARGVGAVVFALFVLWGLYSALSQDAQAAFDRQSLSSYLETSLSSSHKLRKLMPEQSKEVSESKSSWGGGFLFFIGGASGSSESRKYQEVMVRFAWEKESDVYVISELTTTKFRIRLIDHDAPSIQFYMKEGARQVSRDIAQYVNDQNLDYVVLNIKQEHWPISIHVPLNN